MTTANEHVTAFIGVRLQWQSICGPTTHAPSPRHTCRPKGRPRPTNGPCHADSDCQSMAVWHYSHISRLPKLYRQNSVENCPLIHECILYTMPLFNFVLIPFRLQHDTSTDHSTVSRHELASKLSRTKFNKSSVKWCHDYKMHYQQWHYTLCIPSDYIQ